GPSTRIEARIVLTSSYGASRLVSSEASSSTRWLEPLRYLTPRRCSRRRLVAMSRRTGTFSNVSVSAVRRLAHRIGRAAFFAPEMETSPCSRLPPRMSSLSIRFGLIFGGCEGAHRQRVDLGLHAVA